MSPDELKAKLDASRAAMGLPPLQPQKPNPQPADSQRAVDDNEAAVLRALALLSKVREANGGGKVEAEFAKMTLFGMEKEPRMIPYYVEEAERAYREQFGCEPPQDLTLS